MATKKNKNIIARYFTPFGIKQICDITLLIAAIVTIVGLSIFESTTIAVLPIGIGLFILGSLLAVYRSVRVVLSGINKRSPEYKQALVNAIIMGIIALIAIIALVFYFSKYVS